MINKEKLLNTLQLIAEDMEIVGTYFGNHGAAIAALANIIGKIIEELDERCPVE